MWPRVKKVMVILIIMQKFAHNFMLGHGTKASLVREKYQVEVVFEAAGCGDDGEGVSPSPVVSQGTIPLSPCKKTSDHLEGVHSSKRYQSENFEHSLLEVELFLLVFLY